VCLRFDVTLQVLEEEGADDKVQPKDDHRQQYGLGNLVQAMAPPLVVLMSSFGFDVLSRLRRSPQPDGGYAIG
jgi:hypothetical protein